ncbi:sugar-phosphatase [Bacillaceae bacterium]
MKKWETCRLIALDIDGTLLTDDHRLTERTKRAVQTVYRQGVVVALASGRGPASVLPLLRELEIAGPLITYNGAVIIHSESRDVWHEKGFLLEEIRPVVEYCRENKIHVNANTVFHTYVEECSPEHEANYRKFFTEPLLMNDLLQLKEKVVKFTLAGTEEQMTRALADLAPYSSRFHVVRSGIPFIDIMHLEAAKGGALRVLCEKLQIPLSQVIAVGNYYNDIEMLQYAGLGVAVANAPDEVRQAADEIVTSNNDEGVAELLERFVLSR